MKFSTVAFLATVGSAAAFAPSQSFHGRTAPLNMATEAAQETKVCFGSPLYMATSQSCHLACK